MKRIIAVILLVAIGVSVGGGGSVLTPAPRIAYAGENNSVYEDVGKVVVGLLVLKLFLGMCQEKVIVVPHREGYELKFAGDPTLGYFQNKTRNWYIYVFIDDAEKPILVRPGWKREIHLDIGIHKIRAKAYTPTYYGDRLVGVYEKVFPVDGRMREGRYGWRIIFSEWSFRSPPTDQE